MSSYKGISFFYCVQKQIYKSLTTIYFWSVLFYLKIILLCIQLKRKYGMID